MEATTENGLDLAEASKRLAHRMLLISENRLELLLVEIQEERQRILRALWLTVGATAFTLLAAITLTAVIALVFWEHSPVIALSILTALYAAAAIFLFDQLRRLRRDWELLAETINQFKKDRECLIKFD